MFMKLTTGVCPVLPPRHHLWRRRKPSDPSLRQVQLRWTDDKKTWRRRVYLWFTRAYPLDTRTQCWCHVSQRKVESACMIPCGQPETKVRKSNNSSQLQLCDDLHRTLIHKIISIFLCSFNVYNHLHLTGVPCNPGAGSGSCGDRNPESDSSFAGDRFSSSRTIMFFGVSDIKCCISS